MNRLALSMAVLIGAAFLLPIAAWAQYGSPGPAPSQTQTNSQGPVTVKATFLGPGQDGKPRFKVVLDTHSVDLDAYQFEAIALLRDGLGREFRPTGVEALSGSGHHRQGILVFPAADPAGKPTGAEAVKYLELVIKDVGGVKERVFRWNLSPQ